MRIAVPSKSNALGCAYDIVTRNPGFAEAMKFEKGTESFCFVLAQQLKWSGWQRTTGV